MRVVIVLLIMRLVQHGDVSLAMLHAIIFVLHERLVMLMPHTFVESLC